MSSVMSIINHTQLVVEQGQQSYKQLNWEISTNKIPLSTIKPYGSVAVAVYVDPNPTYPLPPQAPPTA